MDSYPAAAKFLLWVMSDEMLFVRMSWRIPLLRTTYTCAGSESTSKNMTKARRAVNRACYTHVHTHASAGMRQTNELLRWYAPGALSSDDRRSATLTSSITVTSPGAGCWSPDCESAAALPLSEPTSDALPPASAAARLGRRQRNNDGQAATATGRHPDSATASRMRRHAAKDAGKQAAVEAAKTRWTRLFLVVLISNRTERQRLVGDNQSLDWSSCNAIRPVAISLCQSKSTKRHDSPATRSVCLFLLISL